MRFHARFPLRAAAPLAAAMLAACRPAPVNKDPVRIAWFFGGRTHGIYRSHIRKEFAKAGVNVELWTQYMNDKDWHKVPGTHKEVSRMSAARRPPGAALSRTWGKVTGVKIIDAVAKGDFEAGTPGESSFVERITHGSDVVAVAMLGFEDRKYPGKAICVRNGVKIDKPSDFKGKTFISRRAGPGDAMILREFLESIGIREDEVRIIDQVDDPEQRVLLREGKADAALLHMYGVPQAEEEEKLVHIYRKMDWIDPNLSHALLVFRRDFIKEHRDLVKRVVRAYMRRLKYEDGLSDEEKMEGDQFGLQILRRYNGLSIPIFKYPPYVRLELLQEVQRLLLKHEYLDKRVDIAPFIDNSFVEEIREELG